MVDGQCHPIMGGIDKCYIHPFVDGYSHSIVDVLDICMRRGMKSQNHNHYNVCDLHRPRNWRSYGNTARPSVDGFLCLQHSSKDQLLLLLLYT